MPRRRPARAVDHFVCALMLLLLSIQALPLSANAGERVAAAAKRDLQLEVTINGQPTRLVAPFVEPADGRLAALRSELDELDIIAPGEGKPDELVSLDTIPNLRYQYDEPAQKLHLTVSDAQRRPKRYDGAESLVKIQPGRADYATAVNYSLYTSAAQNLRSTIPTGAYAGFNGANASLDGRFITPYGTLNQTGVVGSIPSVTSSIARIDPGDVAALRLETNFTYVNLPELMTYRVGDTISGGLNWTRPIRMAGLQAQRNFVVRPDLVTLSLPSFSGSAAVPSTVDVYVNNIKTYSQQVAAGPYQLSNVPILSGGGEARVVVRDASGKEVESKLPFFTAPRLLKTGLYEYSLEAGTPRYNYGIESNDYDGAPAGSVTFRRGMTDWLTAEAHAEGGLDLINGGAGVVVNTGSLAVVSAAVSGSNSSSGSGLQIFGSVSTRVGIASINASSRHALSNYDDLSTITARLRPTIATGHGYSSGSTNFYGNTAFLRPSKALDSVSVSMPIADDRSSISASYVRVTPDQGDTSQILSLSYTRPLIAKATLFATGFKDLEDSRNLGLYIGVSVPFNDVSVATSVTSGQGGTTIGADASKPLGIEPGSWGWRIRDAEGSEPSRNAAVSYRSSIARMEGTVRQDVVGVTETAEISGSLVAMGGSVFASNTIDDGFGVVNAGAPGVRVLQENRYVGTTNAQGTLLMPGLRSNQSNKISIDPTGLPLDAELDKSTDHVVPAFRSGVYVDFKVRTQVPSALLILKGTNGAFLAAGSTGTLEASAETFVVGYDGQTFVKDLKPSNSVVVKVGESQCRATFPFKAEPGTQVTIGPVVCQ